MGHYNFIPTEREQDLLLPPSLREWLPEQALCVYNNETTAPNNLECRAKEKQYVSRRKIPKLT
jgi:hypothetical protein